ncbi:hypothetical protein ACF1HG_00810 [Streptomyces globisporus]|uniref:hypothetical protein n=1 Tax=Streptomyces globisporus TaxID=1908 RepID=UPI0036FE7885
MDSQYWATQYVRGEPVSSVQPPVLVRAITYYLREGLLPAGLRVSATQGAL